MEGMESVVATVSGYHGSERFSLIKLISHSGASYVGSMSRSSTTHLVCSKFEGKKYNLAKKWGIIIVNHRWIEDCIRQRKRVSESPYMLQSGQEIGTLLLELPLITKEHSASSDQSHLRGDSAKEDNCVDCECSGPNAWTDSFLLNELPDSFLLNENWLSKFGKSNSACHKSKRKPLKRNSKQKQSIVRYCFQEPPLSISLEDEELSSDSSTHSVKGKRKTSMHEESSADAIMRSEREKGKIPNGISITSAKPPGKGRRLVKKSTDRNILESMLLDSEQRLPTFRTGGTPDSGFNNIDVEGFEEIEDTNDPLLERVSLDGCSDADNLTGEETGLIEHVNRLTTSIELSCVICWTEFSSTRGVLPCGHRFCYSCIQNWADHMASMRKISTCPLCKASFMSITKVEDAAASDQKIYSQTIPCAPSWTDIFILTDGDRPSISAQPSLVPACSECRSWEPEDLLVRCHLCQVRCIHSYCLDPPLFPWTCIHCRDLQMLYHHSSY